MIWLGLGIFIVVTVLAVAWVVAPWLDGDRDSRGGLP